MPGVLARPAAGFGRRIAAYLSLAAGIGAVCGAGWEAVVDLPSYLVTTGGVTALGERGLTEVIGGDAWFTVLGAVAGVALGVVAWLRLGGLGWPSVLVTVGAALGAGLVCWLVGQHLGPGPIEPRLAAARPGDRVPIELTLRAWPALLVWPFAAVAPVLLGASLGREDEGD